MLEKIMQESVITKIRETPGAITISLEAADEHKFSIKICADGGQLHVEMYGAQVYV